MKTYKEILNEKLSDWDFQDMGGNATKASKNFKHILNIVGYAGKYMLSVISDNENKLYDKKLFPSLKAAKKFVIKKM